MFYYLHELGDQIFGFSVFRYAEFRAPMAAVFAFFVAVLFGRWFIFFQRRHAAFERTEKGDSERLTTLHRHKGTTPTMGGVILLLAVVVSTLLWAQPGNRLVHLLLVFTLACGMLGFIDDLIKLKSRRKGLEARTKLFCQILLAGGAGWYLYAFPIDVEYAFGSGELGTTLFFPFFKHWYVPLGIFYVGLVVVVTTGTSNAVNLTDGLDGLAVGCSILVGVTLVLLSFLAGYEHASSFLEIPHVVGSVEVAVFGAAIVGGGLGFLWFNCHPAQIFMGDTGALALGGALGLMAVICKQEILLILVGGVLVVEVVSVVLQVLSFKLRGKRVFLIAPLHHHFQFKGWNETKVTVRFWIAAAIFALVSLLTLKIRLPSDTW